MMWLAEFCRADVAAPWHDWLAVQAAHALAGCAVALVGIRPRVGSMLLGILAGKELMGDLPGAGWTAAAIADSAADLVAAFAGWALTCARLLHLKTGWELDHADA